MTQTKTRRPFLSVNSVAQSLPQQSDVPQSVTEKKVDGPEEWRAIVGYPAYEVSNHGRVRRIPMTIRPRLAKGYIRVALYNDGIRKDVSVHRLVAQAFVPNPEARPEVNHKDGHKDNNQQSNIEWDTRSGNVQHAFDTGLSVGLPSHRCPKAKLDYEKVAAIRASSEPRAVLAARYGVSKAAITNVKHRHSWR